MSAICTNTTPCSNRLLLTSDDASTAIFVGDGAARVDAELRRRQAVVTDTDLTIAKLSQAAGDITGGSDVEAAAIAAAHESIGTGSESREGNEVLHG